MGLYSRAGSLFWFFSKIVCSSILKAHFRLNTYSFNSIYSYQDWYWSNRKYEFYEAYKILQDSHYIAPLSTRFVFLQAQNYIKFWTLLLSQLQLGMSSHIRTSAHAFIKN